MLDKYDAPRVDGQSDEQHRIERLERALEGLAKQVQDNAAKVHHHYIGGRRCREGRINQYTNDNEPPYTRSRY